MEPSHITLDIEYFEFKIQTVNFALLTHDKAISEQSNWQGWGG
jgi:hypothetical protein